MENQDKKTAIIAGATGLVGEQLLSQLLSDPDYGKVIAIGRHTLAIVHEKLEQHVIDFGQLPEAISELNADHGFCCLGTTIKVAGSKEKQYVIDHDFVIAFAKGCHSAGVSRFAVVSSIGAKATSSNFYLRTKGEMERDLQKILFKGTYILQPSFLLGERKEFRAGEKTAITMMKVLNPLMVGGLKKYRGVNAGSVAQSMINAVKSAENGVKIISNLLLYIFVILLAGLWSCKPDREKCKQEIVQTERDFAKMASEKGVATAFSFYVADSGLVNIGNKFFRGKAEVRKHYDSWTLKDVKLTWAPDFVDVSSSCDLGYTYGKYTFSFRDSTGKINESNGIFHTVWKRQADGTWRFVWD